jgi:hypothetical protein
LYHIAAATAIAAAAISFCVQHFNCITLLLLLLPVVLSPQLLLPYYDSIGLSTANHFTGASFSQCIISALSLLPQFL